VVYKVLGGGGALLESPPPPPPPQELINNVQTVATKQMANIPFNLRADARGFARIPFFPLLYAKKFDLFKMQFSKRRKFPKINEPAEQSPFRRPPILTIS
jgi:hypothetical protein